MRHLRSTTLPAIALGFLLAACAASTPATDADSGSETEPTQSADAGGDAGSDAGGAGGDAAASIDVTVTGGEFAGTYSGSVPDGGCSRGATGENTFGLQYSTDQAVDLSSLQLVVNDASAATGGGTDDFMTTLTFGDLLQGTMLEVQPPEGNGSGTVTVDDRGDTATIEIEAEASDGTTIDATVECHTVFDFG